MVVGVGMEQAGATAVRKFGDGERVFVACCRILVARCLRLRLDSRFQHTSKVGICQPEALLVTATAPASPPCGVLAFCRPKPFRLRL